jgi:hypothetical protein
MNHKHKYRPKTIKLVEENTGVNRDCGLDKVFLAIPSKAQTTKEKKYIN